MSYIMDEARPRAPFTCLAVSAALVAWFDRVGLAVFWTCAAALLALNAVAVAAVLRSRSRTLVNRWTGSVLALNALLLGAGLGVPAAMYTAKMVVRAVQGSSAITWAKGQPESR